MSPCPLVTVLVPARNEAADIAGCIGSVAAQDYPLSRMEVVVVDGCSDDETADAATAALRRYDFAESAVLSNPQATTPSNLNVGLARSAGEVVCRVDARTRIEPHYVRTCVATLLERPDVAVVGGAQVAIARNPSARAVGIARALNNRWSMGGSPYRRAVASGPSDTVYLGAFRRADLELLGGWDNRLVSNQDFDLNRRMSRIGKVWFEASLRSDYLPRETFSELWRQYLRFGRAKAAYWQITGERPSRRQRMLLAMPALALPVSLAAMRRARTRRAAVAAMAAGIGMVEHVGAKVPKGGLASHALSAAAMVIVAAGWLAGVATGAATSTRTPR